MRVRATVLLIRHHAVLLVRERGGPWFLPGGEVGHGELPMGAAIRELHEETGAEASAAAFLWQQASAHHMHHVFRVAIPAEALPRANYRAGIDEVRWVDVSQLGNMPVTPGTRAILSRAAGGNSAVRSNWRDAGAGPGASAGF
ncbi:NUDIX domain-containing protein [Caballeronia sp. Lep1P3]|uniref:NUDIX domain-containing protein n=1 Tax=Caballeronia sp. Lep1P3 TaxID=2878150 RepID=UPI001FD13D8F|nr:NUDIX domain-containing protein [Caballeronia sp. Lep1P3]